MKNDKSLEFKEENGNYVFTSKVNYPNNRTLINKIPTNTYNAYCYIERK